MKTTEVRSFQRAVQEVYAAGAALYVDTFGKLSIDGELPTKTKRYIRDHKEQFRQMLTGDPLMGFGWEGRSVLFEQATEYMDNLIAEKGLDRDRAAEVLGKIEPYNRLNEVWINGSFEDFRGALHDYVRTGLNAARGKKVGTKLKAANASRGAA